MINAPRKLIVIGDSGVYGWGDRYEGGWCERLRRNWMSTPNAPVVYPLGIRGDGLEKVARRWKHEWHLRGELRRKYPEGLLLSVGLNDAARIGRLDGRFQLTKEAYLFGLKQLINEIKKETEVLVLGLTPVDEELMPYAGCLWYSNEAISEYEAQIEEACLETNVPFLSIHKAMLEEPHWRTWIEPDGIHLNSDGHYWIYKRVLGWPALLKWANLEVIMETSHVN
ncbi:GDSL-type esterase/lipase family protein [Prochlorococcus sp. MIT 1341]|uniref:GDSL-type esterase/lipase family protein n=1 Tax=Prochlorococcus sp. MIT 1341 TaxID=3096221 RepID=UPI002A75DD69|nr:GDSL-type esterase/lipase family protein [Prochlorococcus sp. MIT 1341]